MSLPKLAHPKLTLFAFHLRNSLETGFEQTDPQSDRLWQQCEEIGAKLNIPTLQKSLRDRLTASWKGDIGLPPDNTHSRYLELLPDTQLLDFTATPTDDSPELSGEIYPLQIHDTFAIDLTLRYANAEIDIAQLSQLNPDACLLPESVQGSLGETLLLFAKPIGDVSNLETTAQHCLQAILPETTYQSLPNIPFQKGQFLGSPIFAYENGTTDPQKRLQIWIWFHLSNKTEKAEAEGTYYHSLFLLLSARNKILFAFHQARNTYSQLREQYAQLESEIYILSDLPGDRKTRLNELKQKLLNLSPQAFQYAQKLRNLEDHKNTITINTQNYDTYLQKIKNCAFPSDDLNFLEEFLQEDCQRYQSQIQADINYLLPGQTLLDQTIASIRGIIDIDQVESDRDFQKQLQEQEQQQQQAWREEDEKQEKRQRKLERFITFFGTGLAVSGISSQISPQLVTQTLAQKDIPIPRFCQDQQLLGWGCDMVGHILLGIAIAIPVLIFVWIVARMLAWLAIRKLHPNSPTSESQSPDDE
ncbi:hypothetical protein [Geitlerinema sp. PCC 9228]|uniref:hypothetical protein n=1 Tax=Geitlerinema sp. PCC 9228 TaxID=111611 RepID=UPI0008F9E0FA|nr:hypothetical protein [Geitlerinema sp. PCC 9228]